jgi:hypothetical protein
MSKKFSLFHVGAIWFALAFALGGCVVGHDHGERVIVDERENPRPIVVEDVGTLTLLWTVAGTTDPFACYDLGAYNIELVVYDLFGDFVVEAEAPCEDFYLSLDLFDDHYFADITLVDVGDHAVSATSILDDIAIVGGTELVVDVDFPLGSFL